LEISEDNRPNNFLVNVRTLLGEKWFFGDLTPPKSVDEFKGKPVGSFLIRFSETLRGCYTLSQVSENRMVSHHRIKHKIGEPYVLEGSSYQSLSEIIEQKNYDKPLMSPYYIQIFDIKIDNLEETYLYYSESS